MKFKRNIISAAEAAALISSSFSAGSATAIDSATAATTAAVAAGITNRVAALAPCNAATITKRTTVANAATKAAAIINTDSIDAADKYVGAAENAATSFGIYAHPAKSRTAATVAANNRTSATVASNTICTVAAADISSIVSKTAVESSSRNHAKHSATADKTATSKFPVNVKPTAAALGKAAAAAEEQVAAAEEQVARASAAGAAATSGAKTAAGSVVALAAKASARGRQQPQKTVDEHEVFPGYEEDILKHYMVCGTQSINQSIKDIDH